MIIAIIILLAIVINILFAKFLAFLLDISLKKYILDILHEGEFMIIYYFGMHFLMFLMTLITLIALNNTHFHFKY